jgi:hypothetical protein
VAPEREAHRAAGRARELGREERLDARALLRAEPAADELGDDAHLLRPQPEPPCELAPRVEHPLRRDPGRERVAVPARDRGVRLERALDVGGRLARQLDPRVGGREAGVRVTAHRLARLLGEPLLLEPAVDLERGEGLVVGGQRREPCSRPLRRVGRHDGDRSAGPCRLVRQDGVATHHGRISWAEHGAHAGRRPRRLDVETRHAGTRDGGAEDERVEHPRQRDVDGVARRAARPDGPVEPGRRLADDVELRVLGPRLDLVVLVDEHPDVLEASLHLALGLHEAGLHATSCPDARRIARSIFG